MAQMTQKTIDIDHILRSKMGDQVKWVPSPLISWLKRIAHQDEVNRFLWESRDKTGTDWLEECVRYLQMTLVIKGRENLPDPQDGRLYTFVSNHPLGGEDGVALGAIIGRHYDSRFRYLVPYADVSGWHLLTQASRRHTRHTLVQDLYLQECGVPARCSTYPFQWSEFQFFLSPSQFLRPVHALQSGDAVFGGRDV